MIQHLGQTSVKTLEELVECFGPLPSNRIRTDPAPGLATEQDVINIHDRENRLYELIDGVLLEKAMGYYESHLAAVLSYLLQSFLARKNLGIVAGADGMMRLAPGLVRIPAISYVSWERLPGGQIPREPIPDLIPDLAIEILSKSNTKKEMESKLRDYFGRGVRLVWYVDPPVRHFHLFTGPESVTIVDEEGIVDGGIVLPGFSVQVKDFFARADRGPGS